MRMTVRGIIINKKSNKILLLKYVDNKSKNTANMTNGFWVMPGGGVEKGENFLEGLTREIYEETGLKNIEICKCVFSRIVYLDLCNTADYYYERYYLVYSNDEKITFANLTPSEISIVKEYKWWSKDELLANSESVMPANVTKIFECDFLNNTHVIDLTDITSLNK